MPESILADLWTVEKICHLKINYKSDEVRGMRSNFISEDG